MKLITEDYQFEQLGSVESTEFKIKWNAKMSKLLSDTLYSNKIRAILRELGCNAADAQIEAGVNKPFDVKLPSRLDPFFYIRDYGTGLTPEKIKDVYTVYGASDKEDSNQYTGCLGLGSKVMGCYNTKTATIESYVNGRMWTYSFNFGSNGIPTLSLLGEQETTEENGVKILVPTKVSDISSWIEESKNVYKFFKNPPNFIGYEIDLSINKKLEGNDWYFLDTNYETYIVMGNVAYPVDGLIGGLVVEVPIGTVDVDISRERLSYSDYTKNAIANLKTKLEKEIEQVLTDKVQNAKNYFIACKEYYSNRISSINVVPKYKGKPLAPYINIECNEHYMRYGGRIRTRYQTEIPVTGTIYINNATYLRERLKKLNFNSYVYSISTKEKSIQDICSILDCDETDILYTKDIEYTPPKRIKSTTKRGLTCYEYKGGSRVTSAWKSVSDPGGGIYVIISRNYPEGTSLYELHRVRNIMLKGDPSFAIYAFKKEPTNGNWVKFKDWIIEQKKKIINDIPKTLPNMDRMLHIDYKSLHVNSPFRQICESFKKYQKNYLHELVQNDNKIVEDKTYPLLDCLAYYSILDNKKPILQYVQLIDKELGHV